MSDWSSDGCSSDRRTAVAGQRQQLLAVAPGLPAKAIPFRGPADALGSQCPTGVLARRSDERRVGKECGTQCRTRWQPDPIEKTKTHIYITDLYNPMSTATPYHPQHTHMKRV